MAVKILNFPKITDPRGNLTFIQNPSHIPFEIKRISWSHFNGKDQAIAGTASEQEQEVIVALRGSFDVIVTNSNGAKEKFTLNSPDHGLYLPALTWRHFENFSNNCLSFHLSSLKDNNGSIRNFEIFKTKIAV